MTSHKNYTKIVFKLYFFTEKRLLVVFLVMLHSISLLSQDDKLFQNSLQQGRDSTVADTIRGLKRISGDAIEKQVTYTSNGYIKTDLLNKKATIVDKAVVNYDNIRISADSIEFNMETSEVFAVGLPDSTGAVSGKPVLEVGAVIFGVQGQFLSTNMDVLGDIGSIVPSLLLNRRLIVTPGARRSQ